MEKTKYYITISELIEQELTGELSEEQKKELENWINSGSDNRLLYEKIKNKEEILKKIEQTEKIDKKRAWKRINSAILEDKKNIKIPIFNILKYAAIIIIPLLIGIFIKFTFFNNNTEFTTENIEHFDIEPGTRKAVLILSDGTEVKLENNENNKIKTKTGVQINNENNILEYLRNDKENEDIALIYNTLKIPKGGEYSIILADGSKVWLNADTELKYPVRFNDTIRRVFIEGEAYFEVAHNTDKPFIVTTNKLDITVLGTSFNVMAYNNESQIQTTLVAGKVKITGFAENDTETVLKPGFQASLDVNTQKMVSKKVDTYIYTSWKTGKFIFKNEELSSIMRKLSRWYDIETIFKNEELKNYHFSGTLKKYDNISDILNMIELTTNVSFKISERSVVVSKKE